MEGSAVALLGRRQSGSVWAAMTARLIYSMNVSLDGYINDATGSIEWGHVDEELHSWFNDRARECDAFVYGRRLYEIMVPYWPNALDDPDISPVEREFAEVFTDKPKIVFSSTLESVDANSRLVRDDILAALPALRKEFDGELDVGGATLAAPLVEANLIDEYRVVVHPVLLGGGTPFFPAHGARVDLEPTGMHRFGNGATLLTYRPRR
jgi:dihydrofolate reductase